MARTKEKTISSRFGEIVKKIREKKGLSQEKLAELAELDRTYISIIERGKKRPSLEVAYRIALALDAKLSNMIKRAER